MTDWTLNLKDCRLSNGDQEVQLTRKAASVLEVLARRSGEVVRRDEIINAVWGEVAITPSLVREYVFDIRAALGDDARSPRYIETVRGSGFRLLGGISLSGNEGSLASVPSLAVLKPGILGADRSSREAADAIGAELTEELARRDNVAVIAWQSAYACDPEGDVRRTAEFLSVDYLLILNIRVGSEFDHVAFQLICGRSGVIRVIQRLDLRKGDMQTLCENIIARINDVAAISQNADVASPGTFTSKRNAFEEYLLSLDCEREHTLESWRRALVHINKALELDAGLARAWQMRSALLRGLVNLFNDPQLDRETAFRDADYSLRHAYFLDPADPHILAWSAELHIADGNPEAARNALRDAAFSGSTHADTLAYCAITCAVTVGQFDEARTLIDRAVEMNPEPSDWYDLVDCRVAYFERNYQRCLDMAKTLPDALVSRLFGALALAKIGQRDSARAAYEEFEVEFNGFSAIRYAQDVLASDVASRRFLDGYHLLTQP